MEGEPRFELNNSDHAQRREELLGLIRGRLLDGAFDVLANHHTDVLEIVSGHHRLEHQLTREEAQVLEQAVWSAGEDQALDALVSQIERQLQLQGFTLKGDTLDITVHLRQSSTT
jgi:hypothetical protein